MSINSGSSHFFKGFSSRASRLGMLATVATFFTVAAPAAFSSVMDDTAIELRGSTLGAGGELNYAFNSKFTLGLGFNKFSRTANQSASDIDYDMSLKLQTISLLGSYHPFDGVFRFTGGLVNNGNKFTMTAKRTDTYKIGDQTYNGAQVGTLTGAIKFSSLAPYLGLGWGKSAGTGFGVTMDVGVLFQGAPKVEMNANGLLASDPAFVKELRSEESKAESDIKDFTMWPVVALGIDYRF